MKIVLVTGHDYDSPRKTGFHFWADILSARGHEVDFLTVGHSLMTLFNKVRLPVSPYNEWVKKTDRIHKFIWRPVIHPANLRNEILNGLSVSFFLKLYPALLPKKITSHVADADIFVIEVGAGLLLVEALRKLCPDARFIYTVSDRPSTLNTHPVVMEAEKKALPVFSRIRVPAALMASDYEGYPVVHIPQGIDKAAFDARHDNPYKQGKNAISVGDMLFDSHAVEIMADKFPDWTFHLFGGKATIKNSKNNVIVYGEKPFADITPYIQHADIALAPYRFEESAAYLSQSSLKMFQYSYCRLPIVAPFFAAQGRPHASGYNPDDERSIQNAVVQAMGYDRTTISQDGILDWNQVIDRMLAD